MSNELFPQKLLLTVLAVFGLSNPVKITAGEFLPERLLYEPYLASSRTVQTSLGLVTVDKSDIQGVSDDRWDIRIGQRFGIYRSDSGWEVSGFVGFNGLFDIDNNTDNIGWDGRYGFTLATEWRPGESVKLESRHQSAHIGDELIASTGRQRLEYTREEFNVGYSNTVLPSIRMYAETGWAWDLRNDSVQDPWRIQTGIEYGIGRGTIDGSERPRGPFVALDLESMEERDWELDVTLQGGWLFSKRDRLWRAAIEYRHGRVPLGEFFDSEEDYLSVSISLIGL